MDLPDTTFSTDSPIVLVPAFELWKQPMLWPSKEAMTVALSSDMKQLPFSTPRLSARRLPSVQDPIVPGLANWL